MVTAVVLFNIARGKVGEVADALVELDGISEVYSVAGRYDLIAVIRVKTNEEMADLVTTRISPMEDILGTETLIAFKAFSRHDLESMFAVGLTDV